MNKREGFTLIEIVVTLMVIGVLIAVAVPAYQAKFEKVRGAEARGILMQAYAGWQRIRAEGEAITACVTWQKLGMQDPNSVAGCNFAYSMQGAALNPNSFRAIRIGNASRWLRVSATDGKLTVTEPY